MKKYSIHIDTLLSPSERAVLKKLSTPNRIQDFLDSFPVNFAKSGEPIQPPRWVLRNKRAHCMEGAVLAAAVLAYHGHEPWLMDFQTTDDDEDHVIALFKDNGYWGAISKTNHPVLRWRDPIYRSLRELAMSYAHEYYLWHGGKGNGIKTLRAYSGAFTLASFSPEKWFAPNDLDWLAERLDASRHFPIAPPAQIKKMRRASNIETKAMKLEEWKKPRSR